MLEKERFQADVRAGSERHNHEIQLLKERHMLELERSKTSNERQL